MKYTKIYLVSLAGLVLALCLLPSTVLAAQSSSTNYQVNEVFFGAGGDLQDCSANYCAKQSAGALAVGNASSQNYQMQAGFNTSDKPVLEVAVNGGIYDLGVLDASGAHATSASFTVRNYLSSNYVVRVSGHTPTEPSGGHVLSAATTPTTPTAGSEIFGINLRANTVPKMVGADPQQLPDSTFGYGYAAPGYNTANKYQFNDNDIVARSDKSSGETYYTMSIIAGASNQTAAGEYGGALSVIVIPTF